MDNEKLQQSDASDGKHEAARRLAEAAIDGDGGRDDLMDQAARTDPQAVDDVLSERSADAPGSDTAVQDDDEIAAMTRTVEPGSAAPSRAGITGAGSGADSEH